MEQSYNWLLPIIESCKDHFQLECCQNLVAFFKRNYSGEPNVEKLYNELYEKIEAKDASLTV